MHQEESFDTVPILLDRYSACLVVPRRLSPVVRATFADVAQIADDPSAHRVEVVGLPGAEYVVVDGRRWVSADGLSVPEQLLYALLRATLDADEHRLHLHAGYVSLGGRGLILAGNPGSGKSTLIAQLVGLGFDYLTDERVAVGPDLRVSALPKPITVVRPSFDVLASLDPRRTGRGSWSDRGWNLPASAIRLGSFVMRCEPVAVVFVQYSPRGTEVRPIHPVTAARRLLADSPDAVRYGERALDLVAQWCAALALYELDFDGGPAAARVLQSLSRAPQGVRRTVEAIGPGDRQASRGGHLQGSSVPGLVRGVNGICIDDRCLLRRSGDGDLVELDEAHSVWLRLADGVSSLTDIVNEAAQETGADRSDLLAAAVRAYGSLADTGLIAP